MGGSLLGVWLGHRCCCCRVLPAGSACCLLLDHHSRGKPVASCSQLGKEGSAVSDAQQPGEAAISNKKRKRRSKDTTHYQASCLGGVLPLLLQEAGTLVCESERQLTDCPSCRLVQWPNLSHRPSSRVVSCALSLAHASVVTCRRCDRLATWVT